MHKIPVFREPDDDEPAEPNEEGGSSQPSPPEKQPSIDDLTEFEKFTAEQLERITADEISAALQKEEEFLKTLTPNLNTLQDYEKKVSFVFFKEQKRNKLTVWPLFFLSLPLSHS